MILQALKEYYERLAEEGKVSTPGWCQAKVSYAIELRADGDIKAIFDLREEKGEGKRKRWEPKTLRVPEMVPRSSGISANFLCDNAKYLLGIDADPADKRAQDCFLAAKKKHLEILKGADSMMARAVCAHFEKWDPQKAKENPAGIWCFPWIRKMHRMMRQFNGPGKRWKTEKARRRGFAL